MKTIKIKDLLYKPTIEYISHVIYGETFIGINKSPNVYVVETDEDLSDKISIVFDYKGTKYYLKDINTYDTSKDNIKIIECKYWEESLK